jgi:hypothetical protein
MKVGPLWVVEKADVVQMLALVGLAQMLRDIPAALAEAAAGLVPEVAAALRPCSQMALTERTVRMPQ